MQSSLNIFEKIVIKRLKKEDGFDYYEKLDKKYKNIKAPDFLFRHKRDNYQFLAEIKQIIKFPKKEKCIKDDKGRILAYQLDIPTVTQQILEDVDRKRKELVKKEKQYTKLPYIFFVFNCEWHWDNFGFLNRNLYENFPYISAIFREIKQNPKESEWKNLSLEDLKRYIENDKGARFREIYKWEVFINRTAKNKIKIKRFSNTEILN